ncbi:DUF1266 domain-containing protein [Streptomyces syringium]|uniref:DUF1266 domain-containing protein n=1 Tax=Streptomyces syringium TaxID=76729 RepID=UPI0033EF000B
MPQTVAPSWSAPSAVERALFEAKVRGDWAAYFNVLSRTDLFMVVSRLSADSHPDSVVFTPSWSPATGTSCLAVFTEGMLPAPVEDPVFYGYSLGWYARGWSASDPPFLVVNPGSPCEAFFPTTPAHRAMWQQHADRAPADSACCTQQRGKLRALLVGGPLHGAVAYGLACGALLAVRNGELWNALAYHGGGYRHERKRLKDGWGFTHRQDLQHAEERLLNAGMVSTVWEFALSVRRSLARDFAGPVDLEHWRQVAEGVLRRNAAQSGEVRITPEGVTRVEASQTAAVESQVAGVRRLIGRIARYEARFRADGLLPEGAFVRTAEAWDYGRASCMARWGLAARYCTLHEAEEAVLRASHAAQAAYRSWEEFSAAFILGRCLHFDEEEFGPWYTDVLAAHEILTTDPASPWLNIPWK